MTWLLAQKGDALPRAERTDGVIGHDPGLVGWPWVAGTHSWLEPTALAILALAVKGSSIIRGSARGSSSSSIGSRSTEAGTTGTSPFSEPSCARSPARRGLLSWPWQPGGDRAQAVAAAVAYLHATLGGLRAAVSLGWGVLGLRAHHALPLEAETWLAEAHARCSRQAGRRHGTGPLAAGLERAGYWAAPGSRVGQAVKTEVSTVRSDIATRGKPHESAHVLTGNGGAAAIGMGADQVRDWNERSLRARVFIAKASSYQADLESIIAAGLRELGLSPPGRKGGRSC